jgi:hypothetical protein
MNNKPIYFEMPNFDTPPESRVRLGQIIHDCENPTDVVAPPPTNLPLQHAPEVYTSIQSDWQSSRKRLVNGYGGVWTHFLASMLGLGANFSLVLEHEQGDILKFDRLETTFIEPDLEYVRAAMASPEAVRFYEDSPHTPAFIVTGIKVARGAAVQRLRRVKYGVEGSAKIDSTTVDGPPISLGPKASVGKDSTTSTGFSGSSDFVFAYRLRKIVKHKSLLVTASEEYVKGAVHNLDDDDAQGQGRIPEMSAGTLSAFQVSGMEDEDFGYEFLYAGYKLFDVDGCGDEFENGRKEESAQVLIKDM